MSGTRKIQLRQWLILAIAWQFMALWISVYDHLVIHSSLAGSPAEDYSFLSYWLLYSGATFIASLLGGSFLIFYVNTWLAERSYGRAILAVIVCIIVVMIIIILIYAYFYLTLILKIPINDPVFGSVYWDNVFDTSNIKDTMIWSTITALTQFIFQVNAKFGYGVLWKIITGKFRLPKPEKRIFMFVDLNSSTTIAERLGEENYHRLLKDFFARITNPIVNNRGEIYQYVGDEVVIAWTYEKGIQNNHCIHCFFEMKKEIEKNRNYFVESHGLVPTFKAGIHSGKVIAGEIGILKRDITFSGDTLNTTARIRSMCKEFEVDMIVSSELLHALPVSDQFIVRELGSIELKGKEKKIELSTLSMLN